MSEMETIEKLNWLTVIIFLIMGVLHVITPIFFGLTSFAIGMVFFGVLYTSLGILVHLKKENKIIGILSILIPLVGMTLATLSLLSEFNLYLFSVCILTDPVVIILRIYVYKQL